MDEQLKRRLMGAAVLTVLSVLIIPYFFEDKPPKDAVDLPIPLEIGKEAEVSTEVPMPSKSQPQGMLEAAPSPPKRRKYDTVPLDEPQMAAPHAETAPTSEALMVHSPEEEAGSGVSAPQGRQKDPQPSSPQLTPKLQKPMAPPPSQVAQLSTQAKAPTKKPEPPKASKPAVVANSGEPSGAKKQVASEPAKKTTQTPPPAKATVTSSVAPPTRNAPQAAAPAKASSSPPAAPAKTPTPPPAASKNPTSAASGYLVQAGTFSDENNAKSLVEKLKKRNLPVRLQPIESGNGSKVYRVTIGSNLDRGKAEQIQKQLVEEGVRGLILQTR